MGKTLFLSPSVEPVTLAEAKLHCKVDSTDDDALLTSLITAVRLQAEHQTGRVLVTQTWDVTLDEFPDDSLALPYPPLQSVTSITYVDENGISQTLAGTEYQVIINELAGRIVPAYGKYWPSTREQPTAVTVRMVSGYGLAAAVPASIKTWMLIAIATLYAQREAVIVGTISSELPRGFYDGLLDPYRVATL